MSSAYLPALGRPMWLWCCSCSWSSSVHSGGKRCFGHRRKYCPAFVRHNVVIIFRNIFQSLVSSTSEITLAASAAEWHSSASPPEVCQSFREVLSTLRSVGDAHWARAVASALAVCLVQASALQVRQGSSPSKTPSAAMHAYLNKLSWSSD